MRVTAVLTLLAASTLPACGARTFLDDGTTSRAAAGGAATTTTGSGAVTGTGGAPTTSSTTSSGTGPACSGLGDPCTGCLAAACASTYCPCSSDPTCISLLKCLGTCATDDAPCTQACYTQDQSGISTLGLVGGCAASACPKACPGSTPLTPCQSCVFTKCDTEYNTCVATPACVALMSCDNGCGGNPMCAAQCAAGHPGGVAPAHALTHCAATLCAGQCP